MRHGLMVWRENELSEANVLSRQNRLQSVMIKNNLDGMLFYTNHVRPAAVNYLTGFTPYWSDALLFLPAKGQAVFITALSKRVGNWIKATSPTTKVAHSPHPGTLIGEHITESTYKNIGVLEKDHMPGGLMEEITDVSQVNFVDSTNLFEMVRRETDNAELSLVEKADGIAVDAFSKIPNNPVMVSNVTEILERSVRNAGAEECYIAIAPNLDHDVRFGRLKGHTPISDQYAVRLSIAYNGIWIRRTESFSRDLSDETPVHAKKWLNNIVLTIDPRQIISTQLLKDMPNQNVYIVNWVLEAPSGTRPLKALSTKTTDSKKNITYGILTLRLNWEGKQVVLARLVGHYANRPKKEIAA